jgi:hypothetical protein
MTCGQRWSALAAAALRGKCCQICPQVQAWEQAEEAKRATPPPSRNRYLLADGHEDDMDYRIVRVRSQSVDDSDGAD